MELLFFIYVLVGSGCSVYESMSKLERRRGPALALAAWIAIALAWPVWLIGCIYAQSTGR